MGTVRVIVDLYDGNRYDSNLNEFANNDLLNIYAAVQKTFKPYANALNKAGAHIYVDAKERPDSFDVIGISKEQFEEIKKYPDWS
jgi:hypothetical protein